MARHGTVGSHARSALKEAIACPVEDDGFPNGTHHCKRGGAIDRGMRSLGCTTAGMDSREVARRERFAATLLPV